MLPFILFPFSLPSLLHSPSPAAIKRSSLDQAVVAAAPRIGQPGFSHQKCTARPRSAMCSLVQYMVGGTPRLIRPAALCTCLPRPFGSLFPRSPLRSWAALCSSACRSLHSLCAYLTPYPFQQARGGSGTHLARVFQSINEPAARDQSLSPAPVPGFAALHAPSSIVPDGTPASSYWAPFLSPCTSPSLVSVPTLCCASVWECRAIPNAFPR
ncbi:hypothetical protein MAPG_02685 [Magnaporthiopsis poae ATCC 64411]|uniref:Uncharacterized protein n=1 Tax=Magnaporthiopsis poae (strain ATCC 64411 / 73-15) TaxID=644358 RepID=A0A0C4DS15_MAGP6|nr:hypothetical protein MAPG_02685 [Magnaporthiopsis poae ATCC 64411]